MQSVRLALSVVVALALLMAGAEARGIVVGDPQPPDRGPGLPESVVRACDDYKLGEEDELRQVVEVTGKAPPDLTLRVELTYRALVQTGPILDLLLRSDYTHQVQEVPVGAGGTYRFTVDTFGTGRFWRRYRLERGWLFIEGTRSGSVWPVDLELYDRSWDGSPGGGSRTFCCTPPWPTLRESWSDGVRGPATPGRSCTRRKTGGSRLVTGSRSGSPPATARPRSRSTSKFCRSSGPSTTPCPPHGFPVSRNFTRTSVSRRTRACGSRSKIGVPHQVMRCRRTMSSSVVVMEITVSPRNSRMASS